MKAQKVLAAILSVSLLMGGLQGVTGFRGTADSLETDSPDWREILQTYNVEFTSQSENAGDSMPVGGGNLGLNVWAENDEVLFYIGSTDSLDEHLSLLKLGRIRLQMDPNPFENGGSFSQKLDLEHGNLLITGENEQNSARIDIWVDIEHRTVNVELETQVPTTVRAVYENWRTEDNKLPVPGYEEIYLDGMRYTYKDTFAPVDGGKGLLVYHRNRSDDLAYDSLMDQQGLGDIKDTLFNPQKNYTFGSLMEGDGMSFREETVSGHYVETDYTGWVLESDAPQTETSIRIYTYMENTATAQDWIDGIRKVKADFLADTQARERTEAWWADFWDNSHVAINASTPDPEDVAWQIGRNYALTRYMIGCNAESRFPAKFNGGMFTVDPSLAGTGPFFPDGAHGTPDNRFWGGGIETAQNQRILAWPMLKNGDFGSLLSQFAFYVNALENAEAKVKTLWGHDGCMYDEHVTPFGMAAGTIYGWNRSLTAEPGIMDSSCVYQYNNQLEFAFMMLQYYRYTGEDITEYLPFIQSCVTFFYEHYQYRYMQEAGQPFDDQGKLVISPSTAMETFKRAVNPVDLVCALNTIVDDLLALPDRFQGQIDAGHLREVKSHLPQIKYDTVNGQKVISIADQHGPVENFELPELATVWPYGRYHVGSEDLKVAVDTWNAIPDENGYVLGRKGNDDWQSSGVISARLGLLDDTVYFVTNRLCDNDDGRRFPVFYGQTFDWTPNVESASSGMSMVQEMLIQDYDNDVYLLPTWPEEWEADMKLLAGLGSQVSLHKQANGPMDSLTLTQLTDQRESVTLHYPGIGFEGISVTDQDGQAVEVTRGEDSLTFAVEAGKTYTVSGIPDSTLTAPENLQAVREAVGSETVSLAWDAAGSATSYNVYRLSTVDSERVKIGSAAATSFVDTTADNTPGQTVLYAISSVNADGYESAPCVFTPVRTLAENVLFSYTFDKDEAGQTIRDQSGKGNDAQILASQAAQTGEAGLIAHEEGLAYDFHKQAYLRAPAMEEWNTDRDFTLSVDIYPTEITQYRRLFDNDSGGNGFSLDIEPDGRLRYISNVGGNWFSSTITVPANTWSHVEMTYTAADRHLLITLNGQTAIDKILNSAMKASDRPLLIGGDVYGNEVSNFSGAMDNICLTVPLPEEDTIAIPNDRKLLMDFDDGTVSDATSNRWDGQLLVNQGGAQDQAGFVSGQNGGRAYNFAGQTYIQISGAAAWDTGSDVRICADIYPTEHTAGCYRRIFDNAGNTDVHSGAGFSLDITPEGQLRYISNKADNYLTSSLSVPVNTWSHVEMIYTAADKHLVITLNGQTAIDTILKSSMLASNLPLYIGGDEPGNQVSNFLGAMDNIEVYGVGRYAKEAAPVSLTVEADSASLAQGDRTGLTVWGVMADGTKADLSALPVTFTSSNENILTLHKQNGGVYARALQSGPATVTASLTWNGEALTGQTTLTVSVPQGLQSLYFAQGDLNNPSGGDTAKLKVWGVDENGVCHDLTYAAQVTSSDESVAVMTSEGYVKSVGSGEAVLTAEAGGLTATCEILVEREELFSLDFDAVEDGTAPDATGNGRDGQLVGEAQAADGAVSLTGGFVEVQHSADADTGKDFTLEGSFKPSGHGSYYRLFDKKSDNDHDLGGFMLDVQPTGYLRLIGSGSIYNLGYYLPAGEWTHLRICYDSSNKTLLIFANDQLVVKQGEIKLNNVDFNLRLGADQRDGSQYTGEMDNIRMAHTTVTLKSFAVAGVSLEGGDAIITPGGTLQLQPEVTPANARNKKMTWTVTDLEGNPTLLASVSETGLVTAHADGLVLVSATTTDGSGITATKQIRISGQEELVKETTDLSKDWEKKGGGNWSLADGTLTQTGTGNWNSAYMYMKDEMKNLYVEGTFRFTQKDTGTGFAGFKIHGANTDNTMDNTGFYVGVEQKGRIFVYINGRGEMSPTPVMIPGFDETQPFTLSALVMENHVQVAFNGEVLLDYRNDELTRGSGHTAVFSGILPLQVSGLKLQYLGVEEQEPTDPTEPTNPSGTTDPTGDSPSETDPSGSTKPGESTGPSGTPAEPPSTGGILPLSCCALAGASALALAVVRKRRRQG